MLSAKERKAAIEQRLTTALSPTFLEVIDESEFHVGHEGAKTGASHFFVKIAAAEFASLSLIQQHQLIYQQLNDLIPAEIHALKIKILT